MKGVRTRLTALTICPCGAPVLHDDIGVGTEYVIYPESIKAGFVYVCGACGRFQADVTVVLAENRLGLHEPRPLPLALFELVAAA